MMAVWMQERGRGGGGVDQMVVRQCVVYSVNMKCQSQYSKYPSDIRII